jgi:hypothetical protein
MTLVRFAGAAALAVTAAAGASAQQQQLQLPPGRVYAFHSSAQAGYPALDWHLVLQAGGVLDGMVSCNNMQSMARASGNIDTRTGTFQMTAKEVGGDGRTATVSGTVDSDTGWLIANIQAPNIDCHGVKVPWYVPYRG